MGNFEQQRQHATIAALVHQVFPERGDAQGQGGVGNVHVAFFARPGIVNARQFS
jgi:hypothetical protein